MALLIALTPAPRALALVYAAGADVVLASPACGEALCATINNELPDLDQDDTDDCRRALDRSQLAEHGVVG